MFANPGTFVIVNRSVRGRRYPVCVGVDDSGSELRSRTHLFDTAGVEDPAERLRRTIRGMPAGDMIHGLVRGDRRRLRRRVVGTIRRRLGGVPG